MIDRETVIQLAKEAAGNYAPEGHWRFFTEELERFAAAVAQKAAEAEREACVSALQDVQTKYTRESAEAEERGCYTDQVQCEDLAHTYGRAIEVIRARGTGGAG